MELCISDNPDDVLLKHAENLLVNVRRMEHELDSMITTYKMSHISKSRSNTQRSQRSVSVRGDVRV